MLVYEDKGKVVTLSARRFAVVHGRRGRRRSRLRLGSCARKAKLTPIGTSPGSRGGESGSRGGGQDVADEGERLEMKTQS